MMTLAAEFPDVDILWGFKGPVEELAHHRGLTHSFIGAPLDSAIVLVIVYGIHRWRTRRSKAPPLAPRWGLLFLFGIVATLSHILLDFTNNYGVRPLMPFNWRWYSWDIVFIVEPIMLVALFLGLVLPWIFALVSGEIGAHKEKFRGRWCAVVALIAVVALWWTRDYQHRKVVTLLTSSDYRGEVVGRVAAMPYPLNPLVWEGIIETQSFYAKIPIDLRVANLDLQDRARIFYKPAETAFSLAAKKSPLGRAYLDWSRFPVLDTEPPSTPGEDYDVQFRDLRFDYSPINFGQQNPRRSPLSADIFVSRKGEVVLMKMGNHEERP